MFYLFRHAKQLLELVTLVVSGERGRDSRLGVPPRRPLHPVRAHQPAAVQPGQRADPAVAVPARAAQRPAERVVHHVGGHQRRVQDGGSRRRGPAVGRAQEQAQHELRQAESRAQVRILLLF